MSTENSLQHQLYYNNNYYIWLFGFFLGMLSHELKRNMIDGEKAIIQNPTDQQR